MINLTFGLAALAYIYYQNYLVSKGGLQEILRHGDIHALEMRPFYPNHVWETLELNSISRRICQIFESAIPDCDEKMPLQEMQSQMFEAIKRREIAHDLSLKEKFGNKHANIVRLENLFTAFPSPKVKVPSPIGIDKEDVRRFLNTCAPDIKEKWKELKEMYVPGQFALSPKMEEKLKWIEEKIEEAFSKHYEQFTWPASIDRFTIDQKFAVRSTGAEDTKESTNAGGNKSEAFVSSDRKSLAKAISSVVGSYFSSESLSNRLVAGQNPFEDFDSIQLSVTIQPMVGEKIGGEDNPDLISRSFVLVTNEPIYVGEELFRMMSISTTYGHGEGIVGGLNIPADSALILESVSESGKLYILYNNQLKKERLAPFREEDGKVYLRPTMNPEYLQRAPALSLEQLHEIYLMGITIESYFGGEPTDIEGVIKPSDTCSWRAAEICVEHLECSEQAELFPVQARPVVQKALLPTMLKDRPADPLKVKTIISGFGSVMTVSSKKEILEADTLLGALHLYQKNPSRYKAVIISKTETKNTHAFLNFRAWGLPCFYHGKRSETKKFLESVDAEHPLVIDTQRGEWHRWDPSFPPLEIVEGIGEHPADFAISLPLTKDFPITPDPERAVQDEKIEELISVLSFAKSPEEGKKAMNLIEQKISLLVQKIDDLKIKPLPAPALERLYIVEAFHQKLTSAYREMDALIEKKNWREASLQRLFYAKVLKQLLISSPSSLGQYSFLDALSLLEDVSILSRVQEKIPHFLEIFLLGRQSTPEAFQVWENFLCQLEPLIADEIISLEELEHFKTRVQQMHDAGVFSLWLTFFQEEKNDVILRFAKIVEETDSEVFMELSRAKEDIENLTQKLENFAHPESFETNWKSLQKLLSKYDSVWLSSIQTKSSLVQITAIQTLASLIDLCDQAVKNIKSTEEVSEEKRASQMKKMLEVYLPWGRFLAEVMIPLVQLEKWKNGEKYFSEIQDGLMNAQTSSLDPSEDFSVSGAMLGSASYFEYHIPQNLEDFFTLWHQNAIMSLAYRSQELIAPYLLNSQIPTLQKEIMQVIPTCSDLLTPSMVGFQMQDNKIKIFYNVPLSYHSTRFSLEYDVISKELTLHGHFLGNAEVMGAPFDIRWDGIHTWFRLLEKRQIVIPSSQGFHTSQEISFSWKLPSLKMAKIALKEYLKIARSTIETDPSDWWVFPNTKFLEKEINADWVSSLEIFKEDIHHPLSWIILLQAQRKGFVSFEALQELISTISGEEILNHPASSIWLEKTGSLDFYLLNSKVN